LPEDAATARTATLRRMARRQVPLKIPEKKPDLTKDRRFIRLINLVENR